MSPTAISMTENQVLKAVTVSGLTATALAKKVGATKGKQVLPILKQLIKDGKVELDSTGRYDLYKKVKESADISIVKTEVPQTNLPENIEVLGFKISNIKFKGVPMKKIETPDGRKIRIEKDDKLLVINGEPKYTVKTAEDVLKCIRKYTVDNNMPLFVVNDIKQNKKIKNDKDLMVQDNHIISLTIKKHNKAA